MKTRLAIACIIGILLMIAAVDDDRDGMLIQKPMSDISSMTISYTEHDPVIISDNQDFETQGWPGSGIEGDPYLIEGIRIVNTSTCISIEDTTVFFEINHCFISSPDLSEEAGIYFQNVTHGTVCGCTIKKHTPGVYIKDSPTSSLMDNIASGNSHDGYLISESENSILMNNTAADTSGSGFWLRWSSGCTLESNIATRSSAGGILLLESPNCILENNTSSDNRKGISLDFSGNCTILNNTLTGNGLIIDGYPLAEWLHDVSGNTVNGRQLGYFRSATDTVVDGSLYGQVILANCSGVSVRDGLFTDASTGILVGYGTECILENNEATDNSRAAFMLNLSTNCTLKNNLAMDNRYGYYLYKSERCTVINNLASNSVDDGFSLTHSHACTLMDNVAVGNSSIGFNLWNVHDCLLINNTADTSGDGFVLWLSFECQLIKNKAMNNSDRGFHLDYSHNCTLKENTALHNEIGVILSDSNFTFLILNKFGYNTNSNAYDAGYSNEWNNSTTGNYWSDYTGTGEYLIPGPAGSVDHHPFILVLHTTPEPSNGLDVILIMTGVFATIGVLVILVAVYVMYNE
ncbi:MAG: right-handed parallel beta-helix repeat-containing protein [Candidatus Thorarchaeota archaeon]|nr:right-handed parallel beta-helix repeat-containing protein [Candidatus Thorarchaeota archaeon]